MRHDCQEGAMAAAYAQRGLIGTLTPQANTTVEPEMAILLPPGYASIAARMVSPEPAMESRLCAYIRRLPDWTAQFADAKLDAVAFACTGASYLVGAAAEQDLIAHATRRCGAPVVTAGQAVVAALAALSARRVAFVSPYPATLTAASLGYWAGFGIDAAQVVPVQAEPDAAHPIYGLTAATVQDAMRALDVTAGIDAVVLLGTGMPSLPAIAAVPRVGGAPVLSCMLATAWRSVLAISREPPSAANLLAWVDNPDWTHRLPSPDRAILDTFGYRAV
jgi:maleate cis-trans isomerase